MALSRPDTVRTTTCRDAVAAVERACRDEGDGTVGHAGMSDRARALGLCPHVKNDRAPLKFFGARP